MGYSETSTSACGIQNVVDVASGRMGMTLANGSSHSLSVSAVRVSTELTAARSSTHLDGQGRRRSLKACEDAEADRG